MKPVYRPWLLLVLCLAMALAFALYSPIAQFERYHNFADQRGWSWLPHAADVLSNLGFAVVGVLGLRLIWSRSEQQLADMGLQSSWLGYSVFFIALTLTAAGSSWYHLQPDNARLVWDRLPIVLACAGLVDAVLSEQLGRITMHVLRSLLMLLAPLSVLWWSASGDLAPYLFLQLLPLLLIPVVLLLYRARRSDVIGYGLAITAYAVAKVLELSDQPVFELLGVVSGHTLKHVFAALAGLAIYHLLRARQRESVRASPTVVSSATVGVASTMAVTQ